MKKQVLSLALSATMLASMLPKPAFAADNTITFPDMPSDWSTQALQSAINNGLLNGIDGKIAAGENLTRAQMAAIVTRAFGTNGKANISSFGDVNAGDWFYDAMASSVLMGAFQGDGVNLNPNANITRQEAFTVLARLFTLSGGDQSVLSSYTDGAQVADWAKDSMASMVAAGYVKGSDNMLNPRSSITRAEFAQVMDNLVKTYFADNQLNVNANGNAVLNKAGTLEGATISGDLIIGDGAAEGDVVLKDVTVSGRLLVRGGGTSTVTLGGNTTVGSIAVNKPTGAVRVKNNTQKTVNVNALSDNVVLTGDFNEVNANASQGTVTLTGADVATMNVAGTSAKVVVSEKSTVETMNVQGSASGAAVSVQSGTTVGTMNTAASKAVVTVNGTVNTMGVAGSDTTVKAEEGAKIEKITTSAANTTVSGKGSVANFEAAKGSSGADITTDGTKVVNNGTGNVTTGNDKVIASGSTGASKSDSTTPGGGGSTGGGDEGTPILPVSGVGVANLVDKDGAVTNIATNYSVNATRTVGQDYVNVAITASNVKYHTNANNMDGYWVGFSVVAPKDAAKFKVGFADTQEGAEGALANDADGTDLMLNIDGTATGGGEGKKGIAVYSSATADSPKTWVKLQWVNKEGVNVGDATLYKMDLSNVTVAPIGNFEDLKSVLTKGEKNYNISNVTLAGGVALSEAISVPPSKTLTVAKDSTLTGNETHKLTVDPDATVVVNGTVTGTIEGTSHTSKLVISEGGSYNNLPVGTYICKGTWVNVEDLKLQSVKTNFGEGVKAEVSGDGMSVVLSGTVPVDKLTYGRKKIFTNETIKLTVNGDEKKTAEFDLTYTAETGEFSTMSNTFEVDGTTYNVSVNNLFIAKTDVTPKARENGPAAPISDNNYNYKAAYGKAGVTFSGGINAISYTVDAAKLAGFCVPGYENDIKALTHKIGETNYLFVGIQFDTPDIAKNATQAMRYIDGKASTEEAFDLSVDGENAYKKNPMEYFTFGSYTVQEGDATTYAPVASTAKTYEVITYWMDNGGNILAVNFSTVNRTAPTNNN